jgi:hypothetical protein
MLLMVCHLKSVCQFYKIHGVWHSKECETQGHMRYHLVRGQHTHRSLCLLSQYWVLLTILALKDDRICKYCSKYDRRDGIVRIEALKAITNAQSLEKFGAKLRGSFFRWKLCQSTWGEHTLFAGQHSAPVSIAW